MPDPSLKPFSAAERYEFDLKGAVIVRAALKPDLIERLDQGLAKLEGRGPAELPGHCVPSWTPVINEYRLMGLLECDPVFWELIDHPTLLKFAEEFVPKPYRLAEAYSITRLAGLGVPLHAQPEAKYRMTPQGPRSHLLKFAIALSDVGPEDGPMIVFEGTHKLEVPFPFGLVHPDWRAPGVDPDFERYFLRELPNCDPRRWEDIPGYREMHVKAGDLIVMTDDMWHGAKALHSGKRRRTLYYSYVPFHYPNWHRIDYSKELKTRVSPGQRRLLAGPFVGTRYANADTSDVPDDMGFPRLPDSTRDPQRFAAFKSSQTEASAPVSLETRTPVESALQQLTSDDFARDLRGVCQFDLRGSGGGSWFVEFDPYGARLLAGQHARPTTVVELDAVQLLACSAGQVDPVALFYEGQARARGDISLAMRLVDRWNKIKG